MHARNNLAGIFAVIVAVCFFVRHADAQFPDLPAHLLLKPSGNPGLPPGAQTFNPPVAAMEPAKGAPAFAEYTRTADRNESIVFSGAAFSTGTGALFGHDVNFLVYGQTGSNGVMAEARVDRLNDSMGAITLDGSLPEDSMFLVWARNNAGMSRPIALNRTDAWWVGPDAVDNSGTSVASVFGRNLTSGSTRTTAYVYLDAVGGGPGRWVTPISANPYKVDFQIPSALATGTYQVWIHNGRGGKYGWSSPPRPDGAPQTLVVRTPLASGTTITLARDEMVTLSGSSYRVYGDGIHDDTPVIQAAINTASDYSMKHAGTQSKVVFSDATPTTYLLYGALTPRPLTQVVGAGTMAASGSTAWLTTLRRAGGPIVCLPLDSNANDISGNGFDGRISGGGGNFKTLGWKSAGSLIFNGKSTCVTVKGTRAMNLSGRMTIATRVMISGTSPGKQSLVTHGTAGGKKNAVFLRLDRGNLEFGYNVGAGDVVMASAAFDSDDYRKWVSVIASCDKGSWSLYKGDKPVPASTGTSSQGVPAVNGDWSIGADPGGKSGWFTGALDSLRVYGRGLSPLEIMECENGWNEIAEDCAVITDGDEGGYKTVAATSSGISSLRIQTDGQPFVGDGDKILGQFHGASQQWMGGAAVVVPSGTDISYTNLRIEAGPWRGIGLPDSGTRRFFVKDSTIVSNTNDLNVGSMVFIDHVNFRGDYDAEEMINSVNGHEISITHCTAQDENPKLIDTRYHNHGGYVGFAAGRFYSCYITGASQRFVYIGDNTTRDFAPSIYKNDRNAGEQILWDQCADNLEKYDVVPTGSTEALTLLHSGTGVLNPDYDFVIAGGRGLGQRRSIAGQVLTGTGTLIVTVSPPWNVAPDGSSLVLGGRVDADMAIYHNTLNGKSDYATGPSTTASAGIALFNDAYDAVGDSNVINSVRTGIILNGVVQDKTTLPVFNTLWLNNKVSHACTGSALFGGTELQAPAEFNALFRRNTFGELAGGSAPGDRAGSGILASSCNFNLYEDDVFENVSIGVNLTTNGRTGNMVLLNDKFTAAHDSNSTGVVTATENGTLIDPDIIETKFTGFNHRYLNTGTGPYNQRFLGAAAGNNGKLYLATNSNDGNGALAVFDPAHPLDRPEPFLSGTDDVNLAGTQDLVFVNSGSSMHPGSTNPVSATMYVLHGGNAGSGIVSRFVFDASGTNPPVYKGDVLSGKDSLGNVVCMTSDWAGNLYIGTTTPNIWKWDGRRLSDFASKSLMRYQSSAPHEPSGITFDHAGNFYIAYAGVNGIRKFESHGGYKRYADIATPGENGRIACGPDGNVYLASGNACYWIKPSDNHVSGIFTDGTMAPDLAGQTSVTSLIAGPKCATDLSSGNAFDIYLCTSGWRFVGVHGPNADDGKSGREFQFRDDVYPIVEIPIRHIGVTLSPGNRNGGSFEVVNAGGVDAHYKFATRVPWLRVTSNSSGTLGTQDRIKVTFTIDLEKLKAGENDGDVLISYTNSAGSELRQMAVGVTCNR